MIDSNTDPTQLFTGGGECGALMRSMDWSKTLLGPPSAWPQSLRTAVSILLNSRYPMFVFWGPELVKIYNDGYRPITGGKHPWAMGRPGPEVWPEIWDTIGPMVDRVVRNGESTWSDDLLLYMERNGFPEEVYFTFSYSPIRDESGGIGGLFCACTETTQKVLSERRLHTLKDLAADPAEARTVDEACRLSARVLMGNPKDIPFSLLYALRDDGSLRLLATSGVEPGSPAAPPRVEPGEAAAWPFEAVLESAKPHTVTSLTSHFDSVPAGPWPEPPSAAVAVPLIPRGSQRPAGIVVLGTSSRRPLDDYYRDFLSLVAGQITTSLANARASEEERQRIEALAELDRAKTIFFSDVSHEFRTPLTLMLGPLEGAMSAEREPALRGRDLEIVHRNAMRLLKLVNTLLESSRIEAGRIDASYEPTDLARTTAELASVFRAAVEKAGLSLVVDTSPIGEPVYVDRQMWEKIVLNLLSNAFKFTFEGQIAVALRPADGHVELSVRDTGTGIPEEEIPRLFERFYRVRNGRARAQEGSGIGLSLVHDLVELHGGTVDVASELGRGSTFRVTIPLGTDHLPEERVGAERTPSATALSSSAYAEEALRWLPSETNGQHGLPMASDEPMQRLESTERGVRPEAPQTGARDRVLVVDDNADLREYLSRLLGTHWDVETASDGAAALAAMKEKAFDLVLADVMMPEIDGFELVRRLRGDPQTAAIPVILLTARAGEESTVEGLATGADDYLVKPFSARELVARVQAQLALKAVRAELKTEREERLRELEQRLRASELFVGILGHDLRSPLNAITLAARLLESQIEVLPEERAAEPTQMLKPVSRITRSAERMSRMIQQILDFTRARLGSGLPIHRTEVDFRGVVRQVTDELVAQHPDADLRMELDGDLRGRWDADRLAQLVSNLLGNAIEHGVEGARIMIRGDGTQPGVICFEVHNQGVIPADALPEIFEPLKGSSQGARSEGLGLGLFIGQQIAFAHGGKIDVRSHEDSGTRFIVELPRSERHVEASEAPPARQARAEEEGVSPR